MAHLVAKSKSHDSDEKTEEKLQLPQSIFIQ